MKKKIFTFLLALATSVGLMHAAVDDSGSCGDNVTYSFNGTTGALVITGTGPMTEYSSKSNCPWNGYRTSITSVTVTDGVTTVSSNSFGQCTSLQSVTIGNDVETIGEFSFNDCGTNFTSLTLGSSVKSVGFAAFLFGTNIAELVLPESLETINDYAFCQLRAITTVTIPSKVTSIGVSAFYNCIALTSIYTEATTPPTLGDGVFGNVPTSIPLYVPSGSVAAYQAADQWNAFDIQGEDPTPSNVCGGGLTWELSDGVLTISYDGEGTGEMNDFDYEYDDSPVNVAPWKENKSDITTVVIGDGVKSIGNHAFNDLGENFTAVTIANSVERIGLSAFMNSKKITEMTLPSSLKTIDKEGLANCGFATITIPSGVTSIGVRAFCYCSNLTSLTCEATTPPTLASSVFSGISGKQNIPLYVPSESVAAYQDADQWKAFNVQAIPAPQPELAECGLVWTGVPEGGVVGTIGHEDEVVLPQLYATNPDFINALMGGSATVRLGSTDESVLKVFGFNNFQAIAAGECDVYAVHDADATFAYDSVAFHVTIKPAEEPAAEYAEIIFTEAVAADDLAENATFGILGTEFSATISDSGNKMSIDANKCRFGGNEDYKMYEYRLKSGGASSSEKNFITLNIPAAGKIRIAARSSKSDATDRALVIEQGGTELYNAVVMDAQAIEVTEGETTIKVFPYVEVSVTAGSVRVSYTGGMNFYGFGFKAASTPTAVENTAVETKAIKRIVNGQLLIEHNGKLYNITGAQVK